MGEAPATEIRWRRRLLPHDIVEDTESQLLHRHAHAQVDVQCAADPDRTRGLQDSVAGREPPPVGFVVEISATATVPSTLVDLHPLASDTGDAVIGEKVRRIRPDAIGAVRRQLLHEVE